MENRHGLAVDTCVTPAVGVAEREAALAMAVNLPAGATLGADKGYDTPGLVAALPDEHLTPQVAQNTTTRRRSAIVDGRTTRHPGYAVSQQRRKRAEEIFGWVKTIGLCRQMQHRSLRRVGCLFTFALAVYNLVRIQNLTRVAPA